MVIATNLGFPRIGAKRELKKALESYWKGEISADALAETGKVLRKMNWELQKNTGLHHIPSNDFSYYDLTLDTIAMVGAVPARYQFKGGKVDLDTYFAMARGAQGGSDHAHHEGCTHGALDVSAMEITKWFDTNYHYLVPEFEANQNFTLSSTKAVDEFNEAKALGITTRPVLLGPV